MLIVLALLQSSCVDAFNSHPLMANRRPRDPEGATRGHHEVGDHVVASLSDDERIGLLRCQLCHDVKDALQANAKTREASAAGASRMVDDACSILDGALERGGVVFNQRGAAYAQAAAGIAKAACPLLVSELHDPLVAFAGSTLGVIPDDEDAAIRFDPDDTARDPCFVVCPQGKEKQKQRSRLQDLLNSNSGAQPTTPSSETNGPRSPEQLRAEQVIKAMRRENDRATQATSWTSYAGTALLSVLFLLVLYVSVRVCLQSRPTSQRRGRSRVRGQR